MKQELDDYFKRKYARWRRHRNSLPLISWDEDVPSFMYIGEVNDEGYVQWRVAHKAENDDFSEVRKKYNVDLHPDIVEYFNSYWFLELTGEYEDYNIILEPVVPGIGLRDFYHKLEEYYSSHDNQLNDIPIGFEADGLLVLVNNQTGEVLIEDHERGTYEQIADSLKELISQM